MSFSADPVDVLRSIMCLLPTPAFAALSSTCSQIHAIFDETTITALLKIEKEADARPPFTATELG